MTQTPPPYRAPAYTSPYLAYLLNFVRLGAPLLVYDVSRLDPKAIQVSLDKTLPQISKDIIQVVPEALEVLLESAAVMLVTMTEAYLQDVLAFAAERDPTLMRDSTQAASYQEVLSAADLNVLAAEMRLRWARNFLDDGGPTRWRERLERMGARGFAPDTTETMEVHWGIRHLLIHNSGRATFDFVRRHPAFGAAVAEPVKLDRNRIKDWTIAIQNFVDTVEQYMYNRYLRAA